MMRLFFAALSLLPLPWSAIPALAQTGANETPRQNLNALPQIAEQFIHTQTTGLTGTIKVAVEPADNRLTLAACTSPQAFLPNGARLWGKTTIGIKCTAPSPWTIYLRATVQVVAQYIVAATPLAQGQTIGPNDINTQKGDLSNLPGGIITEASQAIGHIANISLAAGVPLRQDALRADRVVQQGQTVRVISSGPGFQITTEARALNNASEGQTTQARTATGQVISGTAKAGGIVEINY